MNQKYDFTTQKQLRREFWAMLPDEQRLRAVKTGHLSTDTRCAFVDWIDSLQKDGQISESLASRVTL